MASCFPSFLSLLGDHGITVDVDCAAFVVGLHNSVGDLAIVPVQVF